MRKAPRVLILNHNLPERGTYFRAKRVAEGFHARGADVTFVCSGSGWYRARTIARKARWTEWHSPSWAPLHFEEGISPLGLLFRAAKLRGNWDLVYTFSHFPVDQGTVKFLRNRVGFWITDWCDLWYSRGGGLHDWRLWAKPLPDFFRGWKGALTRLEFHMEDALEASAVCQADATTIIARPMRVYTRRLGVPDGRVHHMVSGADTARIDVRDAVACRRELGLTPEGPVLSYVANVTPDNRQLESALSLVWEQYPELRLVSAGPNWFPPGSALHREVERGRLYDFGRQPFDRIPTFLGAGDVLLMPIRNLPFNRCRWPNKFGDYMAAGRAIATTRVGDMGRVAERFAVGVAGDPTPEGLAEAILALLADEGLCERSGANGRAAAEGHFSWNHQLEGLFQFLAKSGGWRQ